MHLWPAFTFMENGYFWCKGFILAEDTFLAEVFLAY